PIVITAGAPLSYSPLASNTERMKPTSPATSAVNSLGVIVCQPCGVFIGGSQSSACGPARFSGGGQAPKDKAWTPPGNWGSAIAWSRKADTGFRKGSCGHQ